MGRDTLMKSDTFLRSEVWERDPTQLKTLKLTQELHTVFTNNNSYFYLTLSSDETCWYQRGPRSSAVLPRHSMMLTYI